MTPSNGEALRAVVLGVIDGWGVSAEARRWIEKDCVWVNSLVDRIVSQPIEPAGAVAEPYALWAIENQEGLELPCLHPDIVVTDDLKRYERLKLFILNLGHTFLAEIWSQRDGAPTLNVRDALAEPATRAELDDLYEKEVLPVFAGIGMEREARAYRDTTLERFANPFLDHRLADIFTNHAAKKQRRFGGVIALGEANGLGLAQPRLRAGLLASSDQELSRHAG